MTARLPFKIYIYFFAQSINLTTAVMSVTMAAIVGSSLAPAPWSSTVPYGFQFLLVMIATYPASRLMASLGRKKSFLFATLPLACAGVVGYMAVERQSFTLLVASHALLGIYIAFANFNRFAATDGIPAQLKPKAISLVVAGGVIASVVGPTLTNALKDLNGHQAFAACYAAFVGLAVLSLILNLFTRDADSSHSNSRTAKRHKTGLQMVLQNRKILLAITIAATGYGLMNLLMIQSSMHMSHLHVHFSDVSSAIQWHVLAMFAPSFFTGLIIQRLGLRIVIFMGVFLLLASSSINIMTSDYKSLSTSLIVLGLGWNLTYVGGAALLTQEIEGMFAAIEVQGLNDLGVSIVATIGAFAPALLLSWLGWDGTNILCAVVCVGLFFLSSSILKNTKLTGKRQGA